MVKKTGRADRPAMKGVRLLCTVVLTISHHTSPCQGVGVVLLVEILRVVLG